MLHTTGDEAGPADCRADGYEKIQKVCLSQLASLLDYLIHSNESEKYPVEISRPLTELAQTVDLKSRAEP